MRQKHQTLSLEKYISDNLPVGISLDSKGDELLIRLQAQHRIPFNESNRALYLSILCSLLFAMKFLQIDFEIIVFGHKPLELPDGLFLFSSASLLLIYYSATRAIDAEIYKSLIRGVIKKVYPDRHDLIFRSYVGADEIYHNAIDFYASNIALRRSFVSNFALFQSSIFLIFAITAPFLTGIIFLIQHEYNLTADSIFRSALVIICLLSALSMGINALKVQHELTD